MGDIGKPYALVSGSGEVFGQYVIESLNETGTLHYQDGTPRRIAFDLQLTRVDNDLGGERITVDEQGQFSGDQTQPSTARRRPTLDDLL